MTLTERVEHLSQLGVDIELMTMIFRSEGISDNSIADAYDTVADYSATEVVRGQYYIRMYE